MTSLNALWEYQNHGGIVACLEGLSVEEATAKAKEMGFETIQFRVETYDWSLLRVTFTVEDGKVVKARLG